MTTPADALVALLRGILTDTGSAAVLFDAHVPANPPPLYAVLYPAPGLLQAYDLAHTSDCLELEWQVTSVGRTRPEVLSLAERLRDGQVDKRLAATDFVCGPISHAASQPIRWDDRIADRIVLYATDQYGAEATRA